jgi:hypothetical protein
MDGKKMTAMLMPVKAAKSKPKPPKAPPAAPPAAAPEAPPAAAEKTPS